MSKKTLKRHYKKHRKNRTYRKGNKNKITYRKHNKMNKEFKYSQNQKKCVLKVYQ